MYSQFGEDDKIAELFTRDGVLKADGLVLDIGAWGVKDFSNSRLLIEAGWSAVLCEFSPLPVHELVKEYGKEEYAGRVKVIATAITPGPEHVIRFHITQDALSAADGEHYTFWRETGGYYGDLWVPSLSLHALLDQFFADRVPDFASIDTEGSSVEIAIALMETDHRPRVICVEHDSKTVWLMENVQKYGYRLVWANSTNVILER